MVAATESPHELWHTLASRSLALDPQDIAATVLEDAALAVLDWLACAIAGIQCLPDLVQFPDDHKPAAAASEATLLGRSGRVPLLEAVRINVVLGSAEHLCDFLEPGGVRVGAAVIPVALALAEKLSLSGPELLAAVAVGYDVAAHLSSTLTMPIGSMDAAEQITVCAAVATVAKLMKLDSCVMARALDNVCSSQEVRPASSVALSACIAAQSESRYETTEHSPLLSCVDGTGCWHENAVSSRQVRLHASASHTWSAIDALLALKSAYRLHPEDVAAIEVHTFARAAVEGANTSPNTDAELRQSIPYCLAMVLLRGQVLPNDLSARFLLKAPVGWVMTNTTVRQDAQFLSAHGARVIVGTRYGSIVEHTVLYPRGTSKNPASSVEVVAKFKALVSSALSSDAADQLLQRVLSLPQLLNVRSLLDGQEIGPGN